VVYKYNKVKQHMWLFGSGPMP